MAAGNSYFLGINSNDFFLKDNKKAFILWLNVPKVTAYIHQEAVLVCLHLLRRAADNDEASAAVGAYPLETQVAEGSAHIHGTQLLADTVADDL